MILTGPSLWACETSTGIEYHYIEVLVQLTFYVVSYLIFYDTLTSV